MGQGVLEFIPDSDALNDPASAAATLIPFLDSDGVTFAFKTGFSYDAGTSLLSVPGSIESRASAGAAGNLLLSTAELTVVSDDILGRLDFQAPLESSGGDAITICGSIYSEAENTFSSTTNKAGLVFATGFLGGVTERFRISGTGTLSMGAFLEHVNDDVFLWFETDKFTLAAGGVNFIQAVEGTTDVLNLGNQATITTKICSSLGTLALFGEAGSTRPSAYTQTYSDATRVFSSYTADDESTVYNPAADGEAQLVDLNALRVACENLRAFAENTAKIVNQHTDDWQAFGAFQ